MKENKLKIIIWTLVIISICLISFVGIYIKKYNNMENVVKDYKLSKDFTGYRQVIFEVSDALEVTDADGKLIGNTDQYDDSAIKSNSYKKTDVKVNKEESLNKENYETVKNIFEKRLKALGVEDYNISLDKADGKIYIQMPEDENSDRVISNITETGKFEIKDSKENTVYITTSNLKSVKSIYQSTENGVATYVQFTLNKEGKEILKKLTSNEYAKKVTSSDTNTTNETNTDANSEESKEEKQKELSVYINGSNVTTTSFESPIEDGIIPLTIGKTSTDDDQISENLKSASTIAATINSGELPVVYKVTNNQYLKKDISTNTIRNIKIAVAIIVALLLIFMIIKNKAKGILGAISYLGFIALYLLLIRYTNVEISLSGIIAIALIGILDYILSMKLLPIDKKDKQYKNEYIKFIAKIIPIFVISIVFIFMKWIEVSSFGMLTFWGIVLMIIYNIIVTRNLVD